MQPHGGGTKATTLGPVGGDKRGLRSKLSMGRVGVSGQLPGGHMQGWGLGSD